MPSCHAQGILKKFGKALTNATIGITENHIGYTSKKKDKKNWDNLTKKVNNGLGLNKIYINDGNLQEADKKEVIADMGMGTVYNNEKNTLAVIFDTKNTQLPEFIGGLEAMYSFLKSELNHPRSAIKNSIQGTVLLEFVVECDGSISNVKPIVSLYPKCDKEAIRVVKKMPKWNPGMQMGKPVRCCLILPIRFTLQ